MDVVGRRLVETHGDVIQSEKSAHTIIEPSASSILNSSVRWVDFYRKKGEKDRRFNSGMEYIDAKMNQRD